VRYSSSGSEAGDGAALRLPSRASSLFRYAFLSRGWPIWARYLATTLIIVLAAAARQVLQPYSPGSPFLLFFLGIIVCSALFDHGTGIYSVLLSAALAKWFFIEPLGTLDLRGGPELFGMSVFIAIGLITATMFEALHRVAMDLATTNQRLVASEAEKDFLLQEASHRFKNELTILAALIRLQERAVPAAAEALRSTADRIHVLGRMHERMQRSDGTAVVDSREFIDTLCQDLQRALIAGRAVSVRVEAESHPLAQERAVSVGLIINELVTNALKYAFPDGRSGTVVVRLVRETEAFCISVVDDGIGIDPEAAAAAAGLGQRLIRSMASQLHGTYRITSGGDAPGTEAMVRFPI
jgi:two-component sensor histidine kinase